MQKNYLKSVLLECKYYKNLGDRTFEQLTEEQLFWSYNKASNSIAVIVKHLWGNMRSRWTDFLNTDGEKEWRERDREFENDMPDKEAILKKWNEGWNCLFEALESLQKEDIEKQIYIRNMGHTVIEAVNRQLAHYAYHVEQIVFIGKMICDGQWKSLSIAKGESKKFNKDKFDQPKHQQHFSDDFLKKS